MSLGRLIILTKKNNMAKYKAILIMTVCAVILYGANHLILTQPYFEGIEYDISQTYVFFWLCAALILFVVHVVHAKSPDNAGYVFMGVTLLQMAAAYFKVKHLLGNDSTVATYERVNFFIVFILFLAIETILSIRLLNKSQ